MRLTDRGVYLVTLVGTTIVLTGCYLLIPTVGPVLEVVAVWSVSVALPILLLTALAVRVMR